MLHSPAVARNPVAQDREAARRKWRSLLRMTVARGCTQPEADTAALLAHRLDLRYGFTGETPAHPESGFAERHAADERRAAMRWKWEYRRCGKPNCWCMGTTRPGHGPYKYGKRRSGTYVTSVYIGR